MNLSPINSNTHQRHADGLAAAMDGKVAVGQGYDARPPVRTPEVERIIELEEQMAALQEKLTQGDHLWNLIAETIVEKDGNKEFALFFMPSDTYLNWRAEIGNPSRFVSLGEVSGQIVGEGSTPMDAVLRCLEKVRKSQPRQRGE